MNRDADTLMTRWKWSALVVLLALLVVGFSLTRQQLLTAAAQAPLRVGRCATPQEIGQATLDDVRDRITAQRSAKASSEPLSIPVQFIHITSGSQGVITESQRERQIEVLNAAYADAGITFEYASPPIVHNNSAWFVMGIGTSAERAAKRTLQADPQTTLNFYTCEPPGDVLGWATFPWNLDNSPELDGVVMHWQSLPGGSLSSYNLGQTATHEIGHWLGLFHTFQGGCLGSGDYVDDTVAHREPNSGCPQPGNNGACDAEAEAPVHNYMNYTTDACMTEFTSGQVQRVLGMVSGYRAGLSGGGGGSQCICWLECAVSRIQFPAHILPSLRELRDHLLLKSADGRRLTRLYYQHSPEIFRIMLTDRELAQRTLSAIVLALPSDQGASGQVVLPAELYDECLLLLELLQMRASSQLELALHDVRVILERHAAVKGKVVTLRFPHDLRNSTLSP